jgi:hypothetical protein
MYKVTYYTTHYGECDQTFHTTTQALQFINDCAEDWDEYSLWVEIPLETVIRVQEDA